MDEIRAAGFNVAVPRVGGMDLNTVHEHAALAHQRDMFYMAWIPVGELAHSALVEDLPLLPSNVVGANGATAPILSPNADHGIPLEIEEGADDGWIRGRITGLVCTGADPEFCGMNAVAVSEVTNGYWVFYEGVEDDSAHDHYFEWFRRANQAIEARNLGSWRQPRAEPDPETISADPGVDVELNRFVSDELKVGCLGCQEDSSRILTLTGLRSICLRASY